MRLTRTLEMLRKIPGQHGTKAGKEELLSKWSMPSLFFPTLYRNMFPKSQYKRSQETNARINTGISFVYVLFAGSVFIYYFQKYFGAKPEQRQEESKAVYYARVNTDENKIMNKDYKVSRVKVGWGGIEKEDITDEVRSQAQKEFIDKAKADPDYDIYKDEVYLRKRLGLSPNDPNFDLEWAGVFLRRKDRRSLSEGTLGGGIYHQQWNAPSLHSPQGKQGSPPNA